MIKNRTSHWIVIEESKDNTTFEGSLRSKMSTIEPINDILGLLRYSHRPNSVVQLDVLSIIALFWSYFIALVRSLMTNYLMGEI
jgi:hypothetical protein